MQSYNPDFIQEKIQEAIYRFCILLSMHRKLYGIHFYTSECVRACGWGGLSVDSYMGSGETTFVRFVVMILSNTQVILSRNNQQDATL